MAASSTTSSIRVYLGEDELAAGLRTEALVGLRASPKYLSPTWFYDQRGCELFDAITELPEYYPTRTERDILTQHAADIARISGADTLIELGSGTCEKTRVLLRALDATEQLERYGPFDVAEGTLHDAASQLLDEFPELEIDGVVGDFRSHLAYIPQGGRRLIAMLGGTIGNLRPPERAEMLAELSANMKPGDALLLGTDLVKDRGRLVRAYDDEAGVTAAFNLNVLRRLNRELGADFDLNRFTHVALFNESEEWIEMRLRSIGPQRVTIADLGLSIAFDDGEEILTEVSAKFTADKVRREVQAAGLHLAAFWTDDADDFALSLSTKGDKP
jgi:L-histidine Nalpha-methyltransferase